MKPFRTLAVLLSVVTFVAGMVVVGAWFSWLELSSEAYAFSNIKFAEMWHEHLAAFKLYGGIALLSGSGCLACAWAARKRG